MFFPWSDFSKIYTIKMFTRDGISLWGIKLIWIQLEALT